MNFELFDTRQPKLNCFAFHKIIILHKTNGQYFLFTPLHFCQKLQKFSSLCCEEAGIRNSIFSSPSNIRPVAVRRLNKYLKLTVILPIFTAS